LLVRREVQAVIFDETDAAEMVLILKDFLARRYQWRLLKGGVHNGETETEGLQREIFEETRLKNIKILGKVHQYEFLFKGVKHTVSSYLVKADSKEPIKLQKSEVVDYVWTTKAHALQMLHWKEEKDALRHLKQDFAINSRSKSNDKSKKATYCSFACSS
jgi:ADP-ribose pyrophosphatase YjhB (NUDIX family)